MAECESPDDGGLVVGRRSGGSAHWRFVWRAEVTEKSRDALGVLHERGELLVLEAIAKRLRMGRDQYGVLKPIPDARDWKREASEELLDGCVYLACETLRQRSKS